MIPFQPFPPIAATKVRQSLASVFFMVLLSLGGCETVDFGDGTVTPTDTAAGEASLQLINQRQGDPGPLEFLLYRSNVHDIDNVTEFKNLGKVEFEKSAIVKVPAGQWKFAYRMESGDLRPMPPSLSEAEQVNWPVGILTKDKSYLILIETDDANHTIWRHNIPTE